ncbi:60S ribosomal protein L21-1 [Cinnamomum micranthum f. kanehirae]|uniref:60S ribosomal protein L21-1 n=1 Tax=Cinnamomum micranthum f. kanehirae TaxID=337451 RepID=A0A3S3PX40_9MAGN|nr:60S ribosomal protein L21-1 [Cinnamomum micranthum f. kanehirae]
MGSIQEEWFRSSSCGPLGEVSGTGVRPRKKRRGRRREEKEAVVDLLEAFAAEGEKREKEKMPAGHGLRSRTRDLFSRPFRKKGYIPLTTYLRTYRIGEFVDVKVNGAVHKGMPHKFYHGRTGKVWNVTKRAIGVEINKQVGNRIIKKRIHVRIEHVQPSRCAEDFRLRKVKNDQLKAEAKARGEVISTKRQPEGPKPGFMVEGATLETVTPIPYDVVNDLKGGY